MFAPEEPPPANRGVLSATGTLPQHTSQKFQVLPHLDALSVSIPIIESVRERVDLVTRLITILTGEEFYPDEKPFRFKTVSVIGHKGTRIYWTEDAERDCFGYVYVSFLGTGLKHLSSDSQLELVKNLAELGARATRVDAALTVTSPRISFAGLRRIVESRHHVTKAQKVEIVEGRGKGGRLSGWTFYFGSRESDEFTRIYDKGAEDGSAPPNHKVRFEVEFKNVKAQNLFRRFSECSEETFTQLITDAVASAVDFRKVPGSREHLERCPRYRWWARIVGGFEKLTLGEKVVQKIEQSITWVEDSVSTTLATVREWLGATLFAEWLEEAVSTGQGKMKDRHRMAIRTGDITGWISSWSRKSKRDEWKAFNEFLDRCQDSRADGVPQGQGEGLAYV